MTINFMPLETPEPFYINFILEWVTKEEVDVYFGIILDEPDNKGWTIDED